MAASDYYLCDSCGCKVFYDAEVSYEQDNSSPGGKPWPDNVGSMAVLCRTCSQTKRVVIEDRKDE